MKRKVIKQGHNTLTITIPSDWARRFNLSAGKEVNLDENGNGLIISTERTSDVKRTEFDITGMDIPTIWKYFMSVYREGYDEVLVKFDPDMRLENPYKYFSYHQIDTRYKYKVEKKHISELLQGFVNRFIGFEIIEQNRGSVVIKEMGEPSSKEFDISLRRIFLIIQQMAEETLKALKSNNPKGLAHMHDVDINVDKFHDYCVRILNKFGNKEPKKSELLATTLFMLEILADEYKSISLHLMRDFPDTTKYHQIIVVAETVKEQIDLFYDLFYKFDKEKVIKMSFLDESRFFETHEARKKVKDKGVIEIFHHLRIVSRYISCLTELRIGMEF